MRMAPFCRQDTLAGLEKPPEPVKSVVWGSRDDLITEASRLYTPWRILEATGSTWRERLAEAAQQLPHRGRLWVRCQNTGAGTHHPDWRSLDVARAADALGLYGKDLFIQVEPSGQHWWMWVFEHPRTRLDAISGAASSAPASADGHGPGPAPSRYPGAP